MACRALLVNGTTMWFAACRGPSDVLGLGSHGPLAARGAVSVHQGHLMPERVCGHRLPHVVRHS